MKHIVCLTAATFVALTSVTLKPGSKSTNQPTESALLSATLSDQDLRTEKSAGATTEEEQVVRKLLAARNWNVSGTRIFSQLAKLVRKIARLR